MQRLLNSTIPVLLAMTACTAQDQAAQDPESVQASMTLARERMVEEQLKPRGISDPGVLKAMKEVPRHEFLPQSQRSLAYTDQALPIGYGQTISQPYIVALMTQVLDIEQGDSVLEIGTGSGYQAAVLATLTDEVYSIEILEALAVNAREILDRLQYNQIRTRIGDGYRGWLEHAPFDAIIVTAAPDHVPQPLIDQLAIGGRLVIPVGSYYQELMLLKKDQGGNLTREGVIPVVFVPMTGEAEKLPPIPPN